MGPLRRSVARRGRHRDRRLGAAGRVLGAQRRGRAFDRGHLDLVAPDVDRADCDVEHAIVRLTGEH
jgi:hypothetical protein